MSIEELAKLVEKWQLRYERLGMMNTVGLTTIERMKLDIEYDDARRQLRDAEQNLMDALAAKRESDSLILRVREQ